MFVVSDPVFPRTPIENIFSGLYGVGILFLFAALVITFDNYLYRLDQTYSEFASGGIATLNPNLQVLLTNCNISSTFSIGGFEINAKMDETASHFAFLSHSLMIVGVIANLFLIVINDLTAKGCFFANLRHVRIRGISMPINTICANAMLVQSIAMLILISGSQSGREFLDNYITKCTEQFAATNFTQFIERENNVQNVFGINLNLCIIVVSLNLAIYVFAFIALCIDGFSVPAKKFEDAKYFWESPPTGAPIKKELFHYTQWRNFALECLENDVNLELRPVSYVEFIEDLEAAKADFRSVGDFESEPDHQRSFYDEHFNDDDYDGEQNNNNAHRRRNDGFDDPMFSSASPNRPPRNGGVPFFPGEPEEVDIPEAFDPEDENAEDAASKTGRRTGDGNDDDAQGNFVMLDGAGDGDQLENLPVPLRAPKRNDEGENDNDFDEDDTEIYNEGAARSRQQQQRASADRPYQTTASAMMRKKANESEAERRERHRMRREMETPEERAARKERKRRIRELVANAGGGGGVRSGSSSVNNNNNKMNYGSGVESSPTVSLPPNNNNNNDYQNSPFFSSRGGGNATSRRIAPPVPSP